MTTKPKPGRPRVGRPPKTGPALSATSITVTLTHEQRAAIDRARGGTPRSAWCRDRLMEAVESASD